MTDKFNKVVFARLAMLIFFFIALNLGTDILISNYEPDEQKLSDHETTHPPSQPSVGYFNLSCPFEWSKYSCAYMSRGPKAQEIVRASTDYYLQHIDMIQQAFQKAMIMQEKQKQPKRIFFTGDSLMRQLFVSIACNAATSLQTNLIDHAIIPWKKEWPCHSNAPCFINGGIHGGFDAASIRFVNGMELHFVPHKGFKDDATAEVDVLERLRRDIHEYGRIRFGEKVAMVPGGEHVDVLVYNVGIHYGLGQARKRLNHFVNWIVNPLMELDKNNNAAFNNSGNNIVEDDHTVGGGYSRTRTIYVTTPTQHYNTNNGQWQQGMTKESKVCIDQVPSNPRAELEKELLKPGVTVDVLLDYDDLSLGKLHVHKGNDCSHYCMPGVPDVVGARLLEEFLV